MILVTGATGNVGREVIKLLLEGGEKVAAVTRSPATAALPEGVHVVSGDSSRPASLAPALDAVGAVLISPRAVGDAAAELVALAAERGAERVVLLSAATVEFGGGERRFADGFAAAEDAVIASGLPWTCLRCSDFAANSLAWAPQIRAAGVVRGAYGDAATSPVDERDVAAVAARALVDPDHAGHRYVLTGPESLTQRDKVRLLGEALGKELAWEELPPQRVREAMIAQGHPEDVPDRLLGYLADRTETPGPSSDTVATVLGRPARTFATWAADHAEVFRG
ncbi:NAD(P)H-binding protein [Microtetraspora malaysiensis]|uniref:NAD(P)H-binding protein n=1 Tax=Microtetraspora malaysiensis TaxID=161358 RepID=UPI000835B9B4|nr:NAD(P)H-binding protein [Microtetraspora malaysiensis]